ncbi:MAG TPA: glycoside hydrolase family 2 TIM barrel-domain containing protein [Solirubrobacteraceae bacterium]|nr:glycoside hydrolase family 2 TIM barrel-domain containing protein [Solirubrobacteraceae bacterium]
MQARLNSRVQRASVLALTAVAILLTGSAGIARAQGPAYVAAQPPQQALYRDGWTNRYLLDGQWLYQADPSDAGIANGLWHDNADTTGWTPVTVPNAFNAGDYSTASMYGSVGWYRKDFVLPPAASDVQWIIRFESINYRAQIWLNGYPVGSHAGAYIAFELPLSHLRPGVNRLIVRVDNRRVPTDIPPGPGGGWWNYGGIVREVYLRPVERADLSQVVVRPILPCRRCAATIEEQALVRNVTGKPQTVRLSGHYGSAPVSLGQATIRPHGTWLAHGLLVIARPRLWSIYQPNLYRASLTLTGIQHQQVGKRKKKKLKVTYTQLSGYVTYSGIRSITVSPSGQLELNGRVLHLRGAHIHEADITEGSALDPAHIQQIIGWLRQLGGHLLRAHYPLNPQFLELADQYGILVWSEIPVNNQSGPYVGQPSFQARAMQMLRQNILTNENHPSVLLWSIGNELPEPLSASGTAYISAMSTLAHALDPTRPVGMAVSAWPGLACQAGLAPVDVIGWNDYFGWFDAGGGSTDDRDALGSFLDSLHACYPNKALMVTEFGFDANRNGPVEERGTYQFQANTVAFHLNVFGQKSYLAGAVYFTLQEYPAGPNYSGGNPWPTSPFNQKGLVDLYGNLKPAFYVASAIYHATQQLGPIPPAAARSRPRRAAGASRGARGSAARAVPARRRDRLPPP